jgi:hypothetical protein
MNSIILLIIVLICAYYYNKKYPQSKKNKIYFSLSILAYIIFIYFMNYQTKFVYKVAKNIDDMQRRPLHTILPEYKAKTIDGNNIKYKIADKQNLRCLSCKNNIVLEELNSYKLSYITPLEFGGQNTPENLKLLCPTCFEFRKYS